MKNSKIIIILSVIIAVVLVGIGFHYGREYVRVRADKRATECLIEYEKIIGNGREAIPAERLKPVLSEMTALSKKCSRFVAEQLFARRLDGAFLTGDYALAEKMMDDIPGRSANWKKGAKAKIRAHAALERGDKAAAIDEFESFCKSLRDEGANCSEIDPCSGIEWPYEGLLARNLKRMSDLAAEIGDSERSKNFLAEAREYAACAMKQVADDEEAKAAISKELGTLAQ